MIFGASFDTVAENRAFHRDQEFTFDLLSDTDQRVGRDYEVLRADDARYAGYPERFSYLIDPESVIRRSYRVTDVERHADEVLEDLREIRRAAARRDE